MEKFVQGRSEALTMPSSCILHYSGLSGIRLFGDDAPDFLSNLGDMPGPLIVVENEGTFQGITWEPWSPLIGFTKPSVRVENGYWVLTFPEGAAARPLGEAGTLERAVSFYRREHRPVRPPGYGTLQRIRRAVYLDLWQVNGRIAHHYADARRLVEELDSIGLAEGTLLYLAGWHAPYDTRMPAWAPAEGLGGKAGFRTLVDLCKNTGVIPMPHMNFWGYDRRSGLLDDWESAWSGYRWVGNTGICPGNPIEYMLIDDARWIRLFHDYFDAAVEEFALKAVFLDQCGNAYAHPKSDMAMATRRLLERIHGKYPDLLLGAEVLNENIVEHVPLIQATWLMEENIHRFSPVTRLMFEGRVRFVPHLFLAASVPCRYVYTNMPLIVEHGVDRVFHWYQENNALMGAIPSVRLDYKRSGIDAASLEVLKQVSR